MGTGTRSGSGCEGAAGPHGHVVSGAGNPGKVIALVLQGAVAVEVPHARTIGDRVFVVEGRRFR